MQPPSPRGPGAGALLLAFLAGTLGGAAAALLVQPRAASEGADDAALRQSIAALDETVRALGAQVEGLARTPPVREQGATEPLAAPAHGDQAISDLVDVAMVLGRLEDIAKLLQTRVATTGSGFAGAGALPPLEATQPPSDRNALIGLATEENNQRQIWRRHAFWTCQQVIDAYGLPDQIEAGDGLMGWYYDTGERTLHFEFYEGMLVNLWN